MEPMMQKQLTEIVKRDILFRGLDEENDWIHGSLIRPGPSYTDWHITTHEKEELSWVVDENTVGQFTGWYDNAEPKIRIFEHDLFRRHGDDAIYNVVFDGGQWLACYNNSEGARVAYPLYMFIVGEEPIKVVGNIHETKGVKIATVLQSMAEDLRLNWTDTELQSSSNTVGMYIEKECTEEEQGGFTIKDFRGFLGKNWNAPVSYLSDHF